MVKHKEQIEEILEYYSSQPNVGSQENLVAMLREIQEAEGCIPGEIQQEAADRLGVKESVLACLVKLYPTLKLAPYCHELVLCTGERCGKKDSLEILHAVKKRLKPGKDGISSDQTTLLVTRNCLKHCSTSPNLLLDGVLHTHMTKEKTLSLVEKLLEEKGENT